MALAPRVAAALDLYRDLLTATGQRASEIASALNQRLQACSIAESEAYYRAVREMRTAARPAAPVVEEVVEWP